MLFTIIEIIIVKKYQMDPREKKNIIARFFSNEEKGKEFWRGEKIADYVGMEETQYVVEWGEI